MEQGVLLSPSNITRGTPPPLVACCESIVKRYLALKTCLYLLGRIVYKFNRGGDISHTNLLNNTLMVT